MKAIPAAATCIALAAAWLCAATPAAAQSRDDAVAMVKKGVAAFKADGRDKLIAAANTPNGPFHKGELYLFVFDRQGTLLANPANPRLVGKVLYDLPDTDGKLFRKEIVDNGSAGKSGWTDYKYRNPVSNQVEHKTAYYEPAGDLVLGSGIYK